TCYIYTLSLHDALPIYREAERLGCSEIDHQLESRRLLNGQDAWTCPFQDSVDVARGAPVGVGEACRVRHEPAGLHELSCHGKRRSEEHTSELQSLAYLV